MPFAQVEPEEEAPVRVARVIGPPRPRLRPAYVTMALVAVNLLMALAQVAAAGFRWSPWEIGSDPGNWALGQKVPSLIAHGEYWRLVTANFLHGSWLWHVVFNMIGVLALGRLIEAFYGPARMFVIYVLSCVAGAIASYFFNPGPSLGASTGVMGLMGALLLHNLKYRRYLPDRLNYIYPFLLIILGIQFVMDLLNSQVDIFGHLGGLVGGVVVAALMESRIAGPLQGERDWLPLPTALATACGLLAYGGYGLVSTLPAQVDLLRAARAPNRPAEISALERVVERRPYFVEARSHLGDLLLRSGRREEAARHYKEALRQNYRASYVRRRLDRVAAGYLRQAEAAFNAGQWEAAAANYRQAAEFATDNDLAAAANNGYAWTLADKLNRSFDEAEKYAKAGLTARPDDAAIVDTLAWIYYKQGRYKEALNEQLRAVKLAERSSARTPGAMAELWFHLGAIYEKLDKTDEAIVYYTKALDARPRYREADEALRRLSGEKSVPGRPAPRRDPAAERGII
jgi:rhomboid protease GluP